MTPELIAMHGWAGDSRAWAPWQEAATTRGWLWHSGERGYGALPPAVPAWEQADGHPKVAIGHSLGPHLLPAPVLAAADAVVLLASFGAFLPGGRAERRLRQGLRGMEAHLLARLERGAAANAGVRSMLRSFLARAAEPADPAALLPGPESDPLSEAGCRRLLEDLHLLEHSRGLPEGFPPQAAVLIVEAEADGIVAEEARAQLRQALPEARVERLPGVGHCLLDCPVLPLVFGWLEELLPEGRCGDG
ncbi:MAG: alpha/beta hydrolase [Prochlorococcaceae cyanobacterium]|jgi:pimeloyl-[acyl-carrier protein] methyl ester esterase